jgi:uncharacterized damage-inducible protein DinB
MLEDQLLDTWNIHNRINLYLLDAIEQEALRGVSASKGWSVGQQFAHIHNIRLTWLEPAAADLFESQVKIEKGQSHDKVVLQDALAQSGIAIESLLRRGFDSGRIKGFKPHPAAFLGYLISHESYHRGEIGIILTQAGTPLDKKTAYGVWEWGVR